MVATLTSQISVEWNKMKGTDEIRATNITSPLSSCAQIHSQRENDMEIHIQPDKKMYFMLGVKVLI